MSFSGKIVRGLKDAIRHLRGERPSCRSTLVEVTPLNDNNLDREEGDLCGVGGCDGIVSYPCRGECECHLRPPCHSCTSEYLACSTCGQIFVQG